MINEDPSQRTLVAVIQSKDEKYQIQLLNADGEAVYEALLDNMPQCWYLCKHEFIYYLSDTNILTRVRLDKSRIMIVSNGRVQFIQRFHIDPDIVLKRNPK